MYILSYIGEPQIFPGDHNISRVERKTIVSQMIVFPQT